MNYRIRTIMFEGRQFYYCPLFFYLTLCDAVKKRNGYPYLYNAVEALRKEQNR